MSKDLASENATEAESADTGFHRERAIKFGGDRRGDLSVTPVLQFFSRLLRNTVPIILRTVRTVYHLKSQRQTHWFNHAKLPQLLSQRRASSKTKV